MSQFYDRNGIPMSMEEWGRLRWEEAEGGIERVMDNIRVAHDILVLDDEPITVSTVWLGIDHGFGMSELPVIFETMIFGGKHDNYCQRYCTEDEARAGHAEVMVALTAGTLPLDEEL